MGYFSVFDMFNMCVEDLDFEELDFCILVDEQLLVCCVLLMIDKVVCFKVKCKFLKGLLIIIFMIFFYFLLQGYILYNVVIIVNILIFL